MARKDIEQLAASAVWPAGAALSQQEFCAHVRSEGTRLYRDLPWRGIDDAYGVLVSEVMLQQTQVKRVLGRWEHFMGMFPTPDALAAAAPADVLAEWQGLGYNRRALALKRAAEECSQHHAGALPVGVDALQQLPGIGPATAAGITAFARNQRAVYIETNVRTVFLHLLFPDEEAVPDKQLEPLVAACCPPAGQVRAWYYALLDVGAHLKSQVTNPSRRSAHYTRQSAFEGSRRQKRAELVRIVLACPGIALGQAAKRLDAEERAAGRDVVDPQLFASIVADLTREGFFREEDGKLFA